VSLRVRAHRRGVAGLLAAVALCLAAPAVADTGTTAAAAGAAWSPSAAAGHASVSADDALAAQVLRAINDVRRRYGLTSLRPSAKLAAAAEQHTEEMVHEGYFSHSSSDGSSFGDRIRTFYSTAGFRYWSAGENLLWASPDLNASTAVELWMKSPPHRENLLEPSWREVGLAAVHATSARGAFDGLDVTVVTADFGVRH